LSSGLAPSAALPSAAHVLIGFAEALPAPEVLFSLRAAGYRISVFARTRGMPLERLSPERTIVLPAPEADVAATAALLRAAMTGPYAPDLILPLDDTGLWLTNTALDDDPWIAGATGTGSASRSTRRCRSTRHARRVLRCHRRSSCECRRISTRVFRYPRSQNRLWRCGCGTADSARAMKPLRVVLHANSTWSYDGRWSLVGIARLYGALGVGAVMMTEHDTGFDPGTLRLIARHVRRRRRRAAP